MPTTARFCPACGTKGPEATPHDPVDALLPAAHRVLSARDVDGVEDELFERISRDRARTRALRRSLMVAGAALLVLMVALALAMREPRASRSPSAPAEAPSTAPVADSDPPRPLETAAPAPHADALTLPPRASRATARADAPRSAESRGEPAAMPDAVAPRPPVRVEVAQTPSDGAMEYSVRVTRPDGAPVTDADVRLRGVMSDGAIVEARLDPGREPGVYHSLLAFSPRGPRALTLRVARADGVLEVPVADPAPGGGPARP